jgi:hypothetical protein
MSMVGKITQGEAEILRQLSSKNSVTSRKSLTKDKDTFSSSK